MPFCIVRPMNDQRDKIMNARTGLRIGTWLGVVVVCVFAFAKWQAAQEADRPQQLAWQQTYQQNLWAPVQQRTLTLAGVERVLGQGSLWMISADGEPRLVSRHQLESDDRQWRLQAVIALDEQQTASLVEAQAWQPDSPDQAVSPAVGQALAAYLVDRISMIPDQPLTLGHIEGTFGPAEVRMPVSQGEAWIYPRQGVVVAVSDEQAHSIMFGLHEEL